MKKNNQAGFGVVEVVLIIAVLALVGIVGWRLYSQNKDNKSADTTQPTEQTSAIENPEDLNKATEDLNGEDIDATLDTSEIDAALE